MLRCYCELTFFMIFVLGGWAIIEVLPQPALVGHRVEVTCHVRETPAIREVILYKDGVEVMREVGLGPRLFLTNLTTEDQGMYSCRASWDSKGRTYSVISVTTPVLVLGEFIAEFCYRLLCCVKGRGNSIRATVD